MALYHFLRQSTHSRTDEKAPTSGPALLTGKFKDDAMRFPRSRIVNKPYAGGIVTAARCDTRAEESSKLCSRSSGTGRAGSTPFTSLWCILFYRSKPATPQSGNFARAQSGNFARRSSTTLTLGTPNIIRRCSDADPERRGRPGKARGKAGRVTRTPALASPADFRFLL